MAIRPTEPTWADAHLVFLRYNVVDDLYDLVEDFRQHVRLQQLQSPCKEESHSAFVANSANTNSSKPNSPTFQEQRMPSKPGLCGDTHWLADCPYLVQKKQAKGWNPSQTKQKKVDEALQDAHTKSWVERTLERRKEKENSKSTGQQSSSGGAATSNSATGTTSSTKLTSTNVEMGAFTYARSASTYSLQTSWILDYGSDSHISNYTMLSQDSFFKPGLITVR